jgi:hypothetical protein
MGGGAAPGGGGIGGGADGGCWLISIVPLNRGAAAPFSWNPHLVQLDAVSEFCVPQFGQNTNHLPSGLASVARVLRARGGGQRN